MMNPQTTKPKLETSCNDWKDRDVHSVHSPGADATSVFFLCLFLCFFLFFCFFSIECRVQTSCGFSSQLASGHLRGHVSFTESSVYKLIQAHLLPQARVGQALVEPEPPVNLKLQTLASFGTSSQLCACTKRVDVEPTTAAKQASCLAVHAHAPHHLRKDLAPGMRPSVIERGHRGMATKGDVTFHQRFEYIKIHAEKTILGTVALFQHSYPTFGVATSPSSAEEILGLASLRPTSKASAEVLRGLSHRFPPDRAATARPEPRRTAPADCGRGCNPPARRLRPWALPRAERRAFRAHGPCQAHDLLMPDIRSHQIETMGVFTGGRI